MAVARSVGSARVGAHGNPQIGRVKAGASFAMSARMTTELAGAGELSEQDLLSILLGSGSRARAPAQLADRILLELGGVEGLSRAGPGALAELPGMGPAKAMRLVAAVELGVRISQRRRERLDRPVVRTSDAVAELMQPLLAHLDHEEMWVLSLDGRSAVKRLRRVAQGGQHGLSVSARDILRAGIYEAASALVLVHNHPSGDPTPSSEDVAMTEIVRDAAEIVGMPLVDHVVVARGAHASMLDQGLLEGCE